MNRSQLLYGLVAGGTIFLGLPVAFLRRISKKTSGFLTASSTGILVFLLVDIAGKSLESIEELLEPARASHAMMLQVWAFSAELLVGLAIGLLGMAYFENRYIRGGKDKAISEPQGAHLALMIATGIGIHNLTEGLAIAQAQDWTSGGLALSLALGFALHNATEGFGIAAPLSDQPVSARFLLLLGLIGGGPTLLGVILGSYWQSHHFAMFSFGLAAGAILYVVGELLHLGRRLKGELVIQVGLLIGFSVALVTEMLVTWYSL
jgi:zinc transporter ZupT